MTTKQQRDDIENYLLAVEMDQLAREGVFSAFDDLDELIQLESERIVALRTAVLMGDVFSLRGQGDDWRQVHEECARKAVREWRDSGKENL